MMLTPWRLLLWQLAVRLSCHVVTASPCLSGADIFARVLENSPRGELVADIGITGDPGASVIRLCISGENANWFFLEGRSIRLNSSSSRTLDREVQGSILMAELTCYEDDIIWGQYRVIVEVLNENDNKPRFLEKTIQPFYVSELTTVNSIVFTITAVDADGDIITYILDESSPDASYFRIDLPNSGKVLLDKPLDYETKTQLQLVMYAVEANTQEKQNVSVVLTVNVQDGDDQYPQFLPCTPVSQDEHISVCTNPVYTVNITERDQDMLLGFSPGPIHAEDGDRSIDTPLTYTILSGADRGRFVMDNRTGEVALTRPVGNRQLTPTFRLRLMASQLNDPKKYSVTTALVRVLGDNGFPPAFNSTTYKGFIIQSSSPATIVSTYGNAVLLLQATDQDFKDGVNPKIHYSLKPLPSRNRLYHMTQEGVLIARTDRLKAFDRHILQVIAVDEESGEVATASVDIEVLQRGQRVPRGPFGEERMFAEVDTRLAGGIAGAALLLLAAATLLLLLMVRKRRRRRRRDPAERGPVALGRHPNVVNPSGPGHASDDMMSYDNEAFVGEYETSRCAGLHGSQGMYTRKQSVPLPPSGCPGSEHQEGSSVRKQSVPLPPSGCPGSEHQEGSSIRKKAAPPPPPPGCRGSEQQAGGSRLTDLLPVLETPEPQPGNLTASPPLSNRRTQDKGTAGEDKPLERVKEGTGSRTECFPAGKEEQRVERERTEEGAPTGAPVSVHREAAGRQDTDKPTGDAMKTNQTNKQSHGTGRRQPLKVCMSRDPRV